jgi:hypothetical protein
MSGSRLKEVIVVKDGVQYVHHVKRDVRGGVGKVLILLFVIFVVLPILLALARVRAEPLQR